MSKLEEAFENIVYKLSNTDQIIIRKYIAERYMYGALEGAHDGTVLNEAMAFKFSE